VDPVRYDAAGGVVFDGDRVLVLLRPSRNEVRLPKEHIDPGETPEVAAVREVTEESGYADLRVVCSLGEQTIDFVPPVTQRRIIRREHFYLMELVSPATIDRHPFEFQFVPEWRAPEVAAAELTYPGEREWLRRAVAARK
jgi:8-oxo-dGTP pyrophosphatase MutT (NUDIX family)